MSEARLFELQCWELFVRGATPQQIAEEMGKAATAVRDAIDRAGKYRAQIDDVEVVRAQRLAGLMAQRVDLIRRLEQPHPLLDRAGRPVMVDVPHPDNPDLVRPVPAEDHLVAAALHRELRQLDQRIAALTGSDAATKWEIVAGGQTVEVREARVVDLKARAAQIKLMPRPEAIDATSTEVDEQKEA